MGFNILGVVVTPALGLWPVKKSCSGKDKVESFKSALSWSAISSPPIFSLTHCTVAPVPAPLLILLSPRPLVTFYSLGPKRCFSSFFTSIAFDAVDLILLPEVFSPLAFWDTSLSLVSSYFLTIFTVYSLHILQGSFLGPLDLSLTILCLDQLIHCHGETDSYQYHV